MSRNGSGTMSVVNTLVSGTPITAAAHNQNYSDIASEITNSVAVDGQSTMTAPLKAASGTAALPSYTFGTDPDTGAYHSGSDEYSIAAGGVRIVKITSAGLEITTGDIVSSGAALSVLGVTGNAAANRADINAGADGYVLRRSGSTLGFGTVATAGLTDGAVTLAKQADLASGAFIVRYTASTGAPQAGSFGTSLSLNTSTGVLGVAVPAAKTCIASATASSSASLAFTSGIDATYREYAFALDAVLPVTNAAILQMQVSTDGGSNWKATSYIGYHVGTTTGGVQTISTSTTYIPISSNSGGGVNPSNSAGYGVSCEIKLHNPSGSSTRKTINVMPNSYLGSGGNATIIVPAAGGYWDGNDAINAVRFIESTGNIASGTITMYGIKGS